MARRRHGHTARDQPTTCRKFNPLARHPGPRGNGWRAGLELQRHRARRDLRLSLSGQADRHLLVSQSFPIPGANGPVRAYRDRRPRWHSLQNRPRACGAAFGLDGWRTGRTLQEAEGHERVLQLQPTHAWRLQARHRRDGSSRGARKAKDVEPHAHGPDRPRGSHRYDRTAQRCTLPSQRQDCRSQLDRHRQISREGAPAVHQRISHDHLRRSHTGAEDERGRRGRPGRSSRDSG
ncbi:Uncharacterised protein [Mycobacterium tuberculosis]|nr:Uncharacterised protein [Mycobacterium tuberculosis]